MVLRSMKNMREIDQATPQTRSPEVDYYPLIMVLMRKTLEKVEIPPTAAPAEFPPPIFAIAASVFAFLSFCGALLQRTLGVIYIVVFMSKYVSSRKNQANRTIGGQKRQGGRATCPLLGLQAFQVWSKSPRCFSR